MRKILQNAMWIAALAVAVLFSTPPEALAAVPAITSGAHSAPILHWGWLLGGLALGVVADADLGEQLREIKAAILTKVGEMKTAGESALAALKDQVAALQTQADAIDRRMVGRIGGGEDLETIRSLMEKSDSIGRLLSEKRGTAVLELPSTLLQRKTAIDSPTVGWQTTGVLQIDPSRPGIVTEARERLMIRDVLAARPTTMQVIDFVKVNSPMTAASPQQGEGHTKQENAVTFATVSERVKTLATTIPVSRQVLDDFGELEGFLRTGLSYSVNLAEQNQLLSGSGSGEDLNGLVTQATAFNTALLPLSGSYNRIDYIGRAIQQITAAKELQPTFIVMHPTDWWSIRLTKDTQGRYILGDPMGPVSQQQLFGLTPIITTSIASGTFLVGSGSPTAAEIRDRMTMTVEIATQHSTQFVENMITIRAEKRLALVVYRAASFIKGTFSTSP